MKIEVLVPITLRGRNLEPGYELDSSIMPLYTESELRALVRLGQAKEVDPKPEKKNKNDA